ncbi:MAG: calcium-binding protein [Solirubrobacteraceae bacterium]
MKEHAREAAARLAGWVGVALAAGAFLPAVASAASVASYDASTGTVTIVGGPENNDITTGGGLYMTAISDSAGIVAGPGCEQSDATTISCDNYKTINADLGAGNDTIGTNLGPGTMGVVHGGPGDDKIYGDSGDSQIYGDEGNDYIDGGSGNDYIDGGAGHDQIYGDFEYLEPGDGNDTIVSRDGEQDDVSCGYGWDTVTADQLDRIGSECDQVDRGAAPTPTPTPTPTPAGMSIKTAIPARAKISAVLGKGLAWRCWFSTAGTVGTSLWLRPDQARKLHLGGQDVKLASASGKVDVGWYRITFHVTKAKYRAALRRARTVTARIVVVASDSLGKGVATAVKTIRLVR